jgi:hypothetical protein
MTSTETQATVRSKTNWAAISREIESRNTWYVRDGVALFDRRMQGIANVVNRVIISRKK